MPKRTIILGMMLLSELVSPAAVGAEAPADRPFWRPVIMGTHGMIAAEHPLESLAAFEVLQAGGNAVDAAVAAFYMTTVVEHHQAGIGGDAFIVAYLKDRDEVIFINGTGPAPELATLDVYRALGGIPDAGPLAIERSESLVKLEISGVTKGANPEGWWQSANGVVTRQLGHATFDLQNEAFVEFELVALGRRWGYTRFNGRRSGDESGPLGFVFRLAPPNAFRIAPAAIASYEAKWVITPRRR